MTDRSTNRKLTVGDGGIAGPYIMVSVGQLGAVESVLRQNHIKYWVDEESLSINGGPSIIVVNLGRASRVADVQPLFDAID